MRAKSVIAGSLFGTQTDPGFEPLAIFIYQRNQCDRCLTYLRSEQGQIVEAQFRRSVQHVVMSQRCEARNFIVWK